MCYPGWNLSVRERTAVCQGNLRAILHLDTILVIGWRKDDGKMDKEII